MFGQSQSLSGPSGLSINTGSANALPPNTSQAPISGGLFGSKPGGLFGSTSTSTPQAGTLFGTGSATTQASSLFGSTAATSAPSQAGTLFGTATMNPSGGLFGQALSKPPENGGLFGSVSAGNVQQTGQTQQPAGLFGAPINPTASLFPLSNPLQPQAQQQPGLFGSVQNQNQSANQGQQGGSLFGTFGQAPKPATQGIGGSALFPVAQNKSGLMGSTNMALPQQTQRSIFTSSIGQTSQQQQTVPGVRIDVSNIRGTTRYNDLHEDLQKTIAQVDDFISSQINFQEECESAMPNVQSFFSYLPGDVELCSQKLDTVQRSLETDAGLIDDLKKTIRHDAEEARMSFKAIHSLRVPQSLNAASAWNVVASQGMGMSDNGQDLMSYFSKQADDMTWRLESWKQNISEVERYLKGVESSTVEHAQRIQFSRGQDGSEKPTNDQVRDLAIALRDFESGILGVAGKVGNARETLQQAMQSEGDRSRRKG